MTNLAEVLDFWTAPTMGDNWTSRDVVIRMIWSDSIELTYPDSGQIVLRNKHGKWVDSEQLQPAIRGLPGN